MLLIVKKMYVKLSMEVRITDLKYEPKKVRHICH